MSTLLQRLHYNILADMLSTNWENTERGPNDSEMLFMKSRGLVGWLPADGEKPDRWRLTSSGLTAARKQKNVS